MILTQNEPITAIIEYMLHPSPQSMSVSSTRQSNEEDAYLCAVIYAVYVLHLLDVIYMEDEDLRKCAVAIRYIYMPT